MDEMVLWGIALGLGLVVIVVAVYLLERFVREVDRIEEGVRAIWQSGKRTAQNTATTWMLAQTSERLDDLTREALRHDEFLRTGTAQPKPVEDER
jgi:uncharacterized protein HemY